MIFRQGKEGLVLSQRGEGDTQPAGHPAGGPGLQTDSHSSKEGLALSPKAPVGHQSGHLATATIRTQPSTVPDPDATGSPCGVRRGAVRGGCACHRKCGQLRWSLLVGTGREEGEKRRWLRLKTDPRPTALPAALAGVGGGLM